MNKQLSTLLQNAVEDYLKQFPTITLDHLKEVCEFNLSDIAFKASREVQNFQAPSKDAITSERALELLKQAGQTLLGFPVGERINSITHLQATALKYGFNMFYGINEEPYMCYKILHSYEDNNVIRAIGFEKIKK